MPEEQGELVFQPEDDDRYTAQRGDEHLADVVWKAEGSSEGAWFLSRVGAAEDEKLDRASGKDDVHEALEQATRLLSD